MDWYRYQDQQWIMTVKIQPGARKTEIIGIYGHTLKIKLQAPPIDGRANNALITWLAKEFKVPRHCVNIKYGQHTREKVIVIANTSIHPETLLGKS